LFTASVCQAEVLTGIEVLPDGRKRRILEVAARAIFADDFDGRILPFDQAARSVRRVVRRPTATADLMIAAVARVSGARLVTRDTSGFADCGLTLINPWEADG
jgi:predicted nucleic acid-binding protein